MKKSKLISFAVTIVALAVLVFSLWLVRTSPEALADRERQTAASEPLAELRESPPSVTVDTFVVRTSTAATAVEVAGVLAPVRSVAVGADVAGKVVEVLAEEHTPVAKGEVILRLDPALPLVAVELARAAQQVAQATLRQARSELSRQQDLARRGIASAVELERVQTDSSRATAEVARAAAQRLDATTRLEKTQIVAPFDSVVTFLDLEPGAYVSPGQTIAEVMDLSELEIEIGVSDREIGTLSEGQQVVVLVDVFAGEKFAGTIHRVGRAPDAQTRRYPVPVRLANTATRLLPGMLATVQLDIGGGDALRVPRRAIQQEFDLDYVFEIVGEAAESGDSQGTVVKRRVTTTRVAFRPDVVDITSGLSGGERIATTGVRELRDGLKVRFRDREARL